MQYFNGAVRKSGSTAQDDWLRVSNEWKYTVQF